MRTVKARQILLLIGDAGILYLSLFITILIRYGRANFSHQLELHMIPMSIIFASWLVVLYVNGLYDLYNTKPSQLFFRRFTESWIISVVLSVTIFYLIPFFNIAPRTNLLILSFVFAGLFVLWRSIARSITTTKIRVLSINPSTDLLELLGNLKNNPQLGYEVVGIISHDPSIKTTYKNLTHFSSTSPIRALVSEHNVSLITIPAHSEEKSSHVYRELYELLFWNVYTIPSESFYESLTGRISPTALHDSWFFENLRPNHTEIYRVAQRLIDIILALCGLIFTALITPIVALCITWKSPGPIFYRQERVGKDGKRFKVLKFRTMHVLGADGGAELSGAQFATPNDPRITRAGKIIRTLRIDELPQVLNILKNEMSVVGPRPERPHFVDQFEKHMPYYSVRNLVKPGLTGWAQINYSYAETPEQQLIKFQYDLFYIKNRSLMLDLTILLKTLHVVLYGKGR